MTLRITFNIFNTLKIFIIQVLKRLKIFYSISINTLEEFVSQ